MTEIALIDWAAVMIRTADAIPGARPKKEALRIINAVAAELPAIFIHYGITTERRQAHFISQACIESDYFRTLTEYASGDAYDQRTDMGFTPAFDGDGRTNKGFGIFQTTGPNNQRRALAALKALGFNVSQDVRRVRDVLTQPKYGAWAAGIFWSDNGMNKIADKDSTGQLCSRQVNRGNAYAKKPANAEGERKKMFGICFRLLQSPPLKAGMPVTLLSASEATSPVSEEPVPDVVVAAAPTPDPALVLRVKKLLAEKGYNEFGMFDVDFGPKTQATVRMARRDVGLSDEPIVDDEFLGKLVASPPREVAPARAAATDADLRKQEEGHGVVARADRLSLSAKVLGFFGIGGAADQTGLLDGVKNASEKVDGFKEIVPKFTGYLQWAFHYWWLIALAIAAWVFWEKRAVIQHTVDAFRKGLLLRAK